MKTYKTAVLVTCHNRCKKTVKCLQSLFLSLDAFNSSQQNINIDLKVFLTDDGCTDNTAAAVSKDFNDRDIQIIKGNGQLFWAGGMRVAWEAALEEKTDWDFFLLLNDDTSFALNGFKTLLETDAYCRKHYGQPGLYAGIISSNDKKEITYGGSIYTSRLFGKGKLLQPTESPQPCLLTNANILLVSKNVYEHIGMLDKHYCHRCADWAYGVSTHKSHLPVLTTGNVCGFCDNDHLNATQEKKHLLKMDLPQRYKYFFTPPQCTQDILYYMKRYFPLRFFLVIIARTINILMPRLYYRCLAN